MTDNHLEFEILEVEDELYRINGHDIQKVVIVKKEIVENVKYQDREFILGDVQRSVRIFVVHLKDYSVTPSYKSMYTNGTVEGQEITAQQLNTIYFVRREDAVREIRRQIKMKIDDLNTTARALLLEGKNR